MRYRSTILLLLACLLGAFPMLQTDRAQAACAVQSDGADVSASLFGGDNCPDGVARETGWSRTLQILAGMCLAGSAFFAFVSWREQREERRLLLGAGIGGEYGERGSFVSQLLRRRQRPPQR